MPVSNRKPTWTCSSCHSLQFPTQKKKGLCFLLLSDHICWGKIDPRDWRPASSQKRMSLPCSRVHPFPTVLTRPETICHLQNRWSAPYNFYPVLPPWQLKRWTVVRWLPHPLHRNGRASDGPGKPEMPEKNPHVMSRHGKCISPASNMASFWVSILNFKGGTYGFIYVWFLIYLPKFCLEKTACLETHQS